MTRPLIRLLLLIALPLASAMDDARTERVRVPATEESLTGGNAVVASAILASSPLTLTGARDGNAGPSGRIGQPGGRARVPCGADPGIAVLRSVEASIQAFSAQRVAHREHYGAAALKRAGLPTWHPTAPPSFQRV